MKRFIYNFTKILQKRKGVVDMMTVYDPLEVANNILEKAFLENKPVSPMKLQKLLYFIYRDYLKKDGEALFSERFEAWKYGPVLSSVYREFKKHGGRKITEYSKDENGKAYKIDESSNPIFSSVSR